MNNIKKGRFAEALVAKFLENKGYKILHKNWTCHWGEIDLILLREGCLVFVEVKYRTTSKFGYVEESITVRKKNHLLRSFTIFLGKNPSYFDSWRFDVVCVQKLPSGNFKVRHYKSVELF